MIARGASAEAGVSSLCEGIHSSSEQAARFRGGVGADGWSIMTPSNDAEISSLL